MAVMCASALYFTFSRSAEDDWWWEQRVDPRTGTVYVYTVASLLSFFLSLSLFSSSYDATWHESNHHSSSFPNQPTNHYYTITTLLSLASHYSPRRYSYNHKNEQSSSDGGLMARKAAIKRDFLGTVAYVRSVLATVRSIIASEMKENGGSGGGIAADSDAATALAAGGSSSSRSSSNSSGIIDFPFPLRSLDGVDATLRSVHERAALFELVDVLMRLKQLDLLLADPPVGTYSVLCYSFFSSFSCLLWSYCLSLIHLLLPACLPACIL
jgi:hypothetical protein